MATMKLLFLINILHKTPPEKFGSDNEQVDGDGGVGRGLCSKTTLHFPLSSTSNVAFPAAKC